MDQEYDVHGMKHLSG